MYFEAAIRAGRLALALAAACLVLACSKAPDAASEETQAKPQPTQESAGQQSLMQLTALGPLPAGPAAVVGGKEIGLDQFRAIYDLKLARQAKKGRKLSKREDRHHRSSIAKRLIEQELLRREAEALGIEIDEKALSEVMRGMRDRSRDWNKDLERRAESEESLRQIEIAKMRELAILEKTVDLGILAKEIDEEYERIKPSYDKDTDRLKTARILFETRPGGDRAAALATARKVRALALKPGADFVALGKEHSQSPLTGEMGVMRADRMGKRLAAVLDGFEDGQITEPLETDQGYELIKLIKRYPPGPLPKEALESQIATSLAGRKRLDEGRKLLERLAEKYGVQDNMAKSVGQ